MQYDMETDFQEFNETFVCSECFEDYAISDFIKENAVSQECSYCKKRSEEDLIAADMNNVVRFILDGIRSEWGDPTEEGVGWISKEGGWVSAKVIDTYDLIHDEYIIGDANDEATNDLLHALDPMRQWCQIDPHSLSPEQSLLFSWEQFVHQLKHQTRYVFFRLPETNPDSHGEVFPHNYQILDYLGNIISDLRLVKKIPKGRKFIRVRVSSKMKKYSTVDELGPPPNEKAISQRMSSAGIPLFYGALDIETAMAETYTSKDDRAMISIAEFETKKDLWVLDLRHLPQIPSIFDRSKRELKPAITFLRSFRHDITKPIIKDNRVHIEYVPTQVITEYFNHLYKTEDGEKLNGIYYLSARIANGCSCVLFYNSGNCVPNEDDDSWYQEKILKLVSDSVRHLDVGPG